VAIAGQRNRLAVEVAVGTGGSIKTLPFTIQTKPGFDGKCLLGKACSTRLSRHQQVSWPLTVKRRRSRYLAGFENRQLNEITADDLRALCNKVTIGAGLGRALCRSHTPTSIASPSPASPN